MPDINSFIPRAYPNTPAVKTRSALGVLTFLGVVLFIISLGLYGGAFFYKRLVARQVDELAKSLKRLEGDFEPTLISQFIKTSETIESAKKIIANHRIVSNVLQFLEENTLEKVRFSNFDFKAETSMLSLTGEAASYTTLAQEASLLEKNSLVKNVAFSNLSLNEHGGINYKVDITFDPAITVFR